MLRPPPDLPFFPVPPLFRSVNDFAPAVMNVTLHWPALTAALQLLVPSLTVTFPLSAAPRVPGRFTATLHCTVTASDLNSTRLYSRDAVISVVVVSALFNAEV